MRSACHAWMEVSVRACLQATHPQSQTLSLDVTMPGSRLRASGHVNTSSPEFRFASPTMQTEPVSEPASDNFVGHLQKASDEAIELILEMFGVRSAANRKGGNENPNVGTSFFFGDAEGFNSTKFSQQVHSEWSKFTDGIMGFVSAVHWSEPWIICLGIMHLLLFVLAVSTRKNSNFQISLFCCIMGGIYCAEPLNALMGQHWKSFSKQNYFDKRGLFISSVYSTPLLIVGLTMLVQSLYGASSLLIKCIRDAFLFTVLLLVSVQLCQMVPFMQVKRQQLIAKVREAKSDKKAEKTEDKKTK